MIDKPWKLQACSNPPKTKKTPKLAYTLYTLIFPKKHQTTTPVLPQKKKHEKKKKKKKHSSHHPTPHLFQQPPKEAFGFTAVAGLAGGSAELSEAVHGELRFQGAQQREELFLLRKATRL